MIPLASLDVFLKVAESRSFSEAARRLGLSPSSVSRQISHLEDQLGTRLFQRTTRQLRLSEAGTLYQQHALRIQDEMETARRAVSQLSARPSGRLHVTVEADLARSLIAPLLPEFLAENPEVQLQMDVSTRMVDLVEGGFDLAIRVGHLPDSSLVARRLALSQSRLCASPAYLAQYGRPQRPEELTAHHCLSFRRVQDSPTWVFGSAEQPSRIPVSGPVNAASLGVLRSLTLAGTGIMMAPLWLVRQDLERGDLVTLLPDVPLLPSETPIQAVFPDARLMAPKVRAFVDFLAERLHAL